MQNFQMKYRELDRKLADFSYRLSAGGPYENQYFVPTKDNYAAMEKELAQLKAETENLETPDAPSAIWKSHFLDFLSDTEMSFQNSKEKPAGVLYNLTYSISNAFRLDARPDVFRVNKIEQTVKQIPVLLDAVKTRTDEFSDDAKSGMVGACKMLADQMEETFGQIDKSFTTTSFTAAVRTRLEDALRAYQSMLREFAELPEWQTESTSKEVNDDELVLKFEESYYRRVLHDNLGVELDELLSWYEEELVSSREEVFEIARALDIPENDPKTMGDVNDILLKYAGPYDEIPVMFEKGREYLDRAQAEARKLIWLPEDEYCKLGEVPRSLKFSYPWGGYEGTDRHMKPITGQFFLNEYNYTAVTDGWIKMMAIHEAYPGHHCQYVRTTTDPIPETAKIGAKDIPLLEGTAHRSERLCEYVFAEDPFYPLFVAYRRHHTATRIKADLMLRYFGRPMKEIVQLYMDELGFDRNTARGQIKAQESMEGYFTCYYYGMKKIEDWEKKYGYDPATYTEYLFSVGRISVHNFERFLQLSAEEKKSFCNDYVSLYKNDPEYVNTKEKRFTDPKIG